MNVFFMLYFYFFCTYTQKFWGSSFSSFRGLRVFVLEVFVLETPPVVPCRSLFEVLAQIHWIFWIMGPSVPVGKVAFSLMLCTL